MFKKLFFIITLCFNFQAQAYVDVENNPEAQKLLLSLPSVSAEIKALKKESFAGRSYTQSFIATYANDLPDELSAEDYIANHHVIMFLASDHRFLCEVRINLVWERSTPYKISPRHSETASDFRCYPRI